MLQDFDGEIRGACQEGRGRLLKKYEDKGLVIDGVCTHKKGAKGEIEVWRDFEEDPEALAFESERLLASFTGRTVEEVAEIDQAELPREETRTAANGACAREPKLLPHRRPGGLRAQMLRYWPGCSELLVACHIVAWALDSRQRMNPRNGFCLNALHDRAFYSGCCIWTSRSPRRRS